MENKKKISIRVMLLTITCLLGLMVVMCYYIYSGVKMGLNDAKTDINLMEKVGDQYHIGTYYEMERDLFKLHFSDTIINTPELMVLSRFQQGDFKILSQSQPTEKYHYIYLITYFSAILGYVVIAVLLFLMLFSLYHSVLQENVFSKKNIIRVRTIAILVIVSSLFMSIANWIKALELESLVPEGVLSLQTDFTLNTSEIILGLLLLFIAEFFAIGYKVSQENKLTI